jgi:hypothetical protein
LSSTKLCQVCSACGKKKIFDLYSKDSNAKGISAKDLGIKWSQLYYRRNQIAHECDIVRQAKPQKIKQNQCKPNKIKEDIKFIMDFGEFLSKELEKK